MRSDVDPGSAALFTSTVLENDVEEKRLLNKIVIFVFYCAQKVFSTLYNIKVEPLLSHGKIITPKIIQFKYAITSFQRVHAGFI